MQRVARWVLAPVALFVSMTAVASLAHHSRWIVWGGGGALSLASFVAGELGQRNEANRTEEGKREKKSASFVAGEQGLRKEAGRAKAEEGKREAKSAPFVAGETGQRNEAGRTEAEEGKEEVKATSFVAGEMGPRNEVHRTEAEDTVSPWPRLPEGVPNARITPRAHPAEPISIKYLHIPKAGGTSLEVTMRAAFGRNSVRGGEACWQSWRRHGASQTNITSVRSPRAHMLSMYVHCKHVLENNHAQNITLLGMSDNRSIGFAEWLAHYSRDSKEYWKKHWGDFKCYGPWSFQTHALTCKDWTGNHNEKGNGGRHPPLDQAILALREMAVVVVTDLLPESICLLMYTLKGSLPENCGCGKASFGSGVAHETHGVPKHSLDELQMDQESWRQMDELSAVDQQLYRVALDRFWWEIRGVEAKTGTQLLCPDRVDMLRKSTAYIKGLW